MISNQEVSAIFKTLSEKVIKITDPQIKNKNICDKLAPDLSAQALLIASLGFFSIAYISKITNVTIITSKLVWLVISCSYLLIFILLEIVAEYHSYKSPQEYTERRFNKVSFQAKNYDWSIVNKLAEDSNFKKEPLEFVKIKINNLIENLKEKDEISSVLKNILSISIVAIVIYAFVPNNILLGIVKSNDIKNLSGFLTLLSAVIAGIRLLLELYFISVRQSENSKLKRCLYLIEQAKLMIDSIKID